MIAFIVALNGEYSEFLKKAESVKSFTEKGFTCYSGKISGEDFVLVESGIGKVASGMTAQFVIDRFSPSEIINFGSAGGLISRVKPLNFYVVEKCCQYDFDLSKIDHCPVGYNQNYQSVFIDLKTDNIDFLDKATLASSDRFTCEKSDIAVVENLACCIFDMEGGAIAQVCKKNGVPFTSIKGITDTFGSGIQSEQFVANLSAVCKGFADIIPKVIQAIK